MEHQPTVIDMVNKFITTWNGALNKFRNNFASNKNQYMPTFKFFLSFIFFTFISCKVQSQTAADSISPTFPKVVFVNQNHDVLLYYDDRRQAYEVPSNGFLEGPIDFGKYIDSLAADFGFTYDKIRLGGIFTYIYPKSYSTFIRPYFVVHIKGTSNNNNLKDNKCKWFPLREALYEIKYPASRMIMEKILKYKKNVWTATFEEYGYTNPVDEGKIKFKVLSDFMTLNNH